MAPNEEKTMTIYKPGMETHKEETQENFPRYENMNLACVAGGEVSN